jgi:hypothetical protein
MTMLDRQSLKLHLKSLDKAQVVAGHHNAELEAVVEQFLAGVAAEGRDVDDWEAACLHSALDAMTKHRFGLARANLLHALEVNRHMTPARRDSLTLASLSEALEQVRGLPPKGAIHLHGQPTHIQHHGQSRA